MKIWEEEKVTEERLRKFGTEKSIRKFGRYLDDSLDIWKVNKIELEEKVKRMKDKDKEIKLELEIEEQGKIIFLDIKMERSKENGGIKTK